MYAKPLASIKYFLDGALVLLLCLWENLHLISSSGTELGLLR